MLVVVPEIVLAINMLRFEKMYPRTTQDKDSKRKGWEFVIEYINQDGKYTEFAMYLADANDVMKNIYMCVLKQVGQVEDARVTTELENALRNAKKCSSK